MIYELSKAVHLVAIIVWVAGMTSGALSLLHPSAGTLPAIRHFDQCVTTPAMILVWGFGIWLAVQGGWFGSGWLWIKLLFVVALSALHGVISGRLRRLALVEAPEPDNKMKWMMPTGLGGLTANVVLVTTKAF